QSLPKSHVETRERQTIIPHGVPFMVKLLCYYVSEDSIFLHLEHVQGERGCVCRGVMWKLGLGTTESCGKEWSCLEAGVVQGICAITCSFLHFPGETLWSHLRSKYCVQQGSADVNTVQALRNRGREDGMGSSHGSGQVSVFSARMGRAAPSSSVKPHGPDPAAREPLWGASLTRGRLREQPLSGQCRALASRGHGWRAWAVKEEQVQLWAAEILLALEGLHQQGVLCRDLNPRNLLLDAAGHVRLTFFGQWTEVEPQCCSRAQEELYSAPEVGGITEPTEAADCWSFGALLYELLTGVPLSQNHPSGIQPHTQLHLPEGLSLAATSLLTELLQYNPKRRLGSGGGGMAKLKSHAFFSTIPWNKLVG
ncbi:RPKL1 protein, partial [Alca torda]|nr:RPKL1 protein [Alca torda]